VDRHPLLLATQHSPRPHNHARYDNLSRLLSVLHQAGGSTIDGAVYTVDADGNRTSKADQLAGVTTSYSYDAIYELLQAQQGGTTTETYTYDPVGNRLSSLGLSPYTYNVSNELTQTPNALYSQDYNGNTTLMTDSAGSTTYAWDYENRLTSVTLPGTGGTVTFKYDPFGRRIEKISPTTTSIFTYDGEKLVETVNGSGSEVAHYTQGQSIDEPLAMQRGTTTDYYEADGLGSITSLTAANGSIVQTYAYDSFGNTTNSTGSVTNFFRYTGREFDTETGLYFIRARYFDPTAGRFISEDPIRFSGGVNFYRYVGNNPVNLIDPFGLGPWGTGIGAALGGILGAIVGGGGGTLVAPGVGTVGGGAEGAIEGAAVGAAIAAGIGNAIDNFLKRNPPPTCDSGKQSKCMPLGYDKQLGGCRYVCDDGTMWFEAGPCKAFIYKPWGDGFPKYPPIPTAP
jgi:RHS repeat-associated protein